MFNINQLFLAVYLLMLILHTILPKYTEFGVKVAYRQLAQFLLTSKLTGQLQIR